YQPMLELLAYLPHSGCKTYVVSGGGIEFMRPWVEQVYGIPRQPDKIRGAGSQPAVLGRLGAGPTGLAREPLRYGLRRLGFVQLPGRTQPITSRGKRMIPSTLKPRTVRVVLLTLALAAPSAGRFSALVVRVQGQWHFGLLREWAEGPSL